MTSKTFFSIKCLILLLFSIYWASSLLVNAPNCYIGIKTLSYKQQFKEVFPQQWNFFAPPPDFNSRITYDFFDVNGPDTIKIGSFEAMAPIIEEKINAKPFIAKAEIIDYTLSSTFYNFLEYQTKIFNLIEKRYPEADEDEQFQHCQTFLNDNFFEIYSAQILYNYGVKIAKQEGMYHDNIKMQISLLQIPITRFADRNNPEVTTKISQMYKSEMHPVNRLKPNQLVYQTSD